MKIKVSKQSTRVFSVESQEKDGKRTYIASLSSDTDTVERYGYKEILVHDEGAIDMSRAERGLVLLFNHDINQPIGRINNIKLRDDGKLSGELTFSETEEGQLRQQQVDEGTLTDISIRYDINETRQEENQDTGEFTVYVTRWTPLEGSVVSVPADHTVGFGRQYLNSDAPQEGKAMNIEQRAAKLGLVRKEGESDEQLEARIAQAESAQRSAPVEVDFTGARLAGQNEGQRIERDRQTEIRSLFDAPRYQGDVYKALQQQLIDSGSSIEQARSKLLELVGHETDGEPYVPPTPQRDTQQRTAAPGSNMRISQEGHEVQSRAMEVAVGEKFGFLDTGDSSVMDELKASQYRGWSLSEMARESLQIMGVDTRGLDVRTVVGYALAPHAMPYTMQRSFVGAGTSVFTALVENIANKSMMRGFNESDETWRKIVRIGQVASFRQESRVDLSAFSDLDEIPENGEYTHGKMSDAKEYIQAKKYGKLFSITREMIINDDLDGMQRVPASMGRAADRKVGDLVYAILTGNPNLQDGSALFGAGRGNLVSSGNGAPAVSQLDTMVKLMGLQKDLDSNAHGQNIKLKYLIVPLALQVTSQILAKATNDPDQKSTESGGGGSRPNPFSGTFEVVADPRLDAASSANYYGSADPNLHDTIEVAFINGNQAPSLESQNGWTVDGISYKVRHEVGVAPLGYKGLVKNNG